MPFNQIKKYNQLLELNSFTEKDRLISLKGIFNRDIANNDIFKFREKTIRPIKIDGQPALGVLFQHLTCKTEESKGYKSRTIFDIKRSERLHWIWHHIQEKEDIKIFSVKDRKNGKNVIRTYLFDEKEKYIIILEPFRKTDDYYLLTAYYLEEKMGGVKRIKTKFKRKLDKIY